VRASYLAFSIFSKKGVPGFDNRVRVKNTHSTGCLKPGAVHEQPLRIVPLDSVPNYGGDKSSFITEIINDTSFLWFGEGVECFGDTLPPLRELSFSELVQFSRLDTYNKKTIPESGKFEQG